MAAFYVYRRSPADYHVLEVIAIGISPHGEVHVSVEYVEEEEDIPPAPLAQAQHTNGVVQSRDSENPTISQSGFSALYIRLLPPMLLRPSPSGHPTLTSGPASPPMASTSTLEMQAAEHGEGVDLAHQGPSLPGENSGPRTETFMPTHPYPVDMSHRLQCCAHRDLPCCQCANAALLPDTLCPDCQNDACDQ